MRSETTKAKLEQFMAALGQRVRSSGAEYFTGGATALLFGWRQMTVDVDLKAEPEPAGLFEALAELREELDLNLELASPDQFIPVPTGWRERSLFIGAAGPLRFYHYDPYSQALAKLQRRHPRDLHDVQAMVRDGLIQIERLRTLFHEIEAQLIRYPGIDARSFRAAVAGFCDAPR